MPSILVSCMAMAAVLFAAPLFAKPPVGASKELTKNPPAAATPGPMPDRGVDALAHWLARVPSGDDAILLPFAQVVFAATGKRMSPFDPANKGDAAALSKIAAALDTLLPRMNLPDSPARLASGADGAGAVSRRFEAELRNLLRPTSPQEAGQFDRAYPALAITDDATGKSYYLAVTLYPTDGIPSATAVNIRPEDAASRILADGCCLLIGIEHNGKAGRDIAFMNWQVLDLARTRMRFTPSFHVSGQDALQPGAVLTDGRKGRD